VIYLEDILLQPYKKAGDKELVTRFAQNISQALFFPDNEHIAFVAGDQIKVIELDGRDQRNLAGSHLVRARHPIWVRCTIPYRLKPTATATLDETAAAELISGYINSFDPNDNLDMNDIATQLRINYPVVGTVFPFTIEYDLYSPDGQLIQFSTTDIVSIFSLATNGVILLNSADIVVPPEMVAEGVPEIKTDSQLTEYLTLMGVSDRTTQYRCKPVLITFAIQG
jgi:hypothetical protein